MSHPVLSKKLIVILGPTAVGKTDISLQLATRYQCPVLSADSRQCYKELGVATAKPTRKTQELVKHYFIDTHSIFDPVSAAGFEDYALSSLEEVFQKYNYCIMTGGSGLYVNAVCEGLDDIPPVGDFVGKQLEDRLKSEGLPSLITQLKELDPYSISSMDLDNPRRVIRALEVCLSTGKPFSTFRTGAKHLRNFDILKIGLRREREDLYLRINQRVDQMIHQGLFEEAAELYEFRNLRPLQTVGYQEVFGYMDNLYDREEAIRLLKRNSRRYAKRQLTWFGRDSSTYWFEVEDMASIIEFLDQEVPVPRH